MPNDSRSEVDTAREPLAHSASHGWALPMRWALPLSPSPSISADGAARSLPVVSPLPKMRSCQSGCAATTCAKARTRRSYRFAGVSRPAATTTSASRVVRYRPMRSSVSRLYCRCRPFLKAASQGAGTIEREGGGSRMAS